MFKVHEINGCIVGPGLYQEWATHVHAARSKSEQNLELCRNIANNMLLYRAIKPIRKGDELLAWYSGKVQQELCNLIAPTNDFNELPENETTCKRCLVNFEHINMLKSHLLFDLCSKLISTTTSTPRNFPLNRYESPVSSPSSTTSVVKSTQASKSPLNLSTSTITTKSTAIIGKPLKRGSSSSSSYSSTTDNPIDHHSSSNNKRIKLSPQQIKTETQDARPSISPLPRPQVDCNDKLKLEILKNRQSSLNNKNLDWKITFLDGTQTVELNVADELGKPKKTHVCLFCGKIYNRKYGLKIHLRTHTGYKPLKCKVCSRPFSDPSNLNKHVRLHSQGETPYRCPYCGKVLVRKRDLDRHIISRHTSNPTDTTNNDDEDEDDIDVDGDGNDSDDDENSDTRLQNTIYNANTSSNDYTTEINNNSILNADSFLNVNTS